MDLDQLKLSIRKLADDLSRLDPTTKAESSPTAEVEKRPVTEADRHLARFARQYIKDRRTREAMFSGNLFADPAWDILLDLFVAEVERRAISVSSACLAAAVPMTTALRHLSRLEAEGHIIRHQAPFDRRMVFIRLSTEARQAMAQWLEHSARWRPQLR